MPARAPFVESSHTFCDALSSRTIAKTKSPPSAASFGDEAFLAPEATSASAASGLLFHTVTVCPAFKRLAAIREPIAPRPRNPTLLISTPSSTCRTSRSASLREFPASPFDDDLAEGNNTGTSSIQYFQPLTRKEEKWPRRSTAKLFDKLLILNGGQRRDRTADAGLFR